MIRTVPIPTKSRMGCAPGGGCCSECASHTGPPIGSAPVHTHAILRKLGDLADSTSDLMTGPNVNLNNPALQIDSSSTVSGISPTLMYIGGAVLFIALLEATSQRR